MVELTEEEFGLVFDALEKANNGYTMEEVPMLVAMQGKAWTALQAVKERQK